MCAAVILAMSPTVLGAQAGELVTGGYFEREAVENEPEGLSGASQFIRFYEPARIIRLYIPYPYSTTLSPDAIRAVFHAVDSTTHASAFLKDDFGVLDERAIAHVDGLRTIEGRILFDCRSSSPCEIVFGEDAMVVVNPGIVKDRRVPYRFVEDPPL